MLVMIATEIIEYALQNGISMPYLALVELITADSGKPGVIYANNKILLLDYNINLFFVNLCVFLFPPSIYFDS